MELLIGIALGIPVGVVIEFLLKPMAHRIVRHGWR